MSPGRCSIRHRRRESGKRIGHRVAHHSSMEHSWGQSRDVLSSRVVLVIDEAGMVGTRQLERVLSHAARR